MVMPCWFFVKNIYCLIIVFRITVVCWLKKWSRGNWILVLPRTLKPAGLVIPSQPWEEGYKPLSRKLHGLLHIVTDMKTKKKYLIFLLTNLQGNLSLVTCMKIHVLDVIKHYDLTFSGKQKSFFIFSTKYEAMYFQGFIISNEKAVKSSVQIVILSLLDWTPGFFLY